MENKEIIKNSKDIWFKRKLYGWGWTPSTWQGWAVIIMYIFLVTSNFMFIDNASHSVSDSLMNFFPNLYIITVFLLIICATKGEEPRWQWGEDKGNL